MPDIKLELELELEMQPIAKDSQSWLLTSQGLSSANTNRHKVVTKYMAVRAWVCEIKYILAVALHLTSKE